MRLLRTIPMTTLTTTAVAAFVLLLPGSAAAQVGDAVAVKNAFDRAMDVRDVDAALATFAPDARFTTPGGTVLTGTAQIRAYLQQLVADNYRAEVLETRSPAPDTVFSRGNIALDQFRRLGLASVEATAEVVVQGGRIVSFTTALTPAAAARLQAAQAAAAQRPPAQLPRTGSAPPVPTPIALALGTALLTAGLARRRARGPDRLHRVQ